MENFSQPSSCTSNKAIVLDFDSKSIQELFYNQFADGSTEAANKEFCEGFIKEVENNDVAVYIYTNTSPSQKESVEEVLDAIFDEKASYRLISSKALLFMILGMIFNRKCSVIVYSSERLFIPVEIFQELGITNKSETSVIFRDSKMLKSFSLKEFEPDLRTSEQILSKKCPPSSETTDSGGKLSFQKKELIMSEKTTLPPALLLYPSMSCSTSTKNKISNIEDLTLSSMSDGIANTLEQNNGKYEIIFNDLLPKLLNKKKEKSKEFSKLIVYLNNTVEQHLLKHTHMSTQERQDFFVFTFLKLCKKQWLRGELPDLLMSLPPGSLNYEKLTNMGQAELSIDSSEIPNLALATSLKKSSMYRKNATILSAIVTTMIKMMVGDQEVRSTKSPISMKKLKLQIIQWINTYTKANKEDKNIRFPCHYKRIPNIIVQVLKHKGVITQSEEGVLIDWDGLDLLSEELEKVADQSYFIPYFQSFK
ncbi:unnamed protein product [Moneuplotes crassus]|uniref:Uncharacterized protein n=1 Tax=Euplotes crassus TaxID=5936 RepID=A0AAD1XCE9_EUPCR|nr:unnamed protein product [Moneuplotes crassus]